MPQNNFSPLFYIGNPTAATITLSASGNYIAAIYQLTPGLTVSGIEIAAIASTAGVVNVQLETISSELPSGALIATGASLLNQSITANTWFNFSLTTPYAVPNGSTTYASATIRWVSGSSTFRTRLGSAGNIFVPRMVENGVARYQFPGMALRYSDGSYQSPVYAPSSVNTNTWNNNTNPDEIGNSFISPFNFQCTGITMLLRGAATVSNQLRIYDSNLNVLTTDNECTISDTDVNASNPYTLFKVFKNPIYLIKDQKYYVTCKANSLVSSYDYFSNFNTQALADAYTGLSNIRYCTRNNSSGSFTETAARVAAIAPLINLGFSNHINIG